METPKARTFKTYMRARQHWIDITTYESHFVIKLYTRSLRSTKYICIHEEVACSPFVYTYDGRKYFSNESRFYILFLFILVLACLLASVCVWWYGERSRTKDSVVVYSVWCEQTDLNMAEASSPQRAKEREHEWHGWGTFKCKSP